MSANIILCPEPTSYYTVSCYDHYYRLLGFPIVKRKTPKLKWIDGFQNLVTNVGKAKLLDAAFKTGLTSPAWYIGLKDSGATIAAADTMSSHGAWTELVPYSGSTRPAWTPGSITTGSTSSVDNSGSVAVFNINATATVVGCFLVDNNTKSGTTGTLYGGGDFGAPRSVANGDTLNITVQLQVS
jgi:hypothetical protein